MSIIAGVDIGNATTEIVLADSSQEPPRPVAWDRAPTQGAKGSQRAAQAAARLLRRIERRSGHATNSVVLTPQVPVQTAGYTVELTPHDTGRLSILSRSAPTPSGAGCGVGIPVPVEEDPVLGQPVVLVAQDPLGFRDTAARIRLWRQAGADVQAVLLAGDEAHLLGMLLREDLPILDRIDTSESLRCLRICVEVRPSHVVQLNDALWLHQALDLHDADAPALQVVTELLRGVRSAAVGLLGHLPTLNPPSGSEYLQLRDGRRVPLIGSADVIDRLPVGSVMNIAIEGRSHPCDDAWVVDIPRPSTPQGERRQLALSLLEPTDGQFEQTMHAFQDQWPTRLLGTEASAAHLGACSTPGAGSSSIVIDMGGGTIDVILPRSTEATSITAAGCGQLLTLATASTLDISVAMAEWVKRGPATRAEAPQIVATEDGQRQFTQGQLPTHSVGWLTAPGPAGPLPFTPHLPLGEWRRLRLSLKKAVIGRNLARVFDTPLSAGTRVVLVGGPAGDQELFEALAEQLPWGLLGRGSVAGTLGHRWAVAYGLTILGTREC